MMDTSNPAPDSIPNINSASTEVELFDAWEEEYIERHGLSRCPNCTMPLYPEEECPNCRQLPHEEGLLLRHIGKVFLLGICGIGILIWLLFSKYQ